MFMFFKDECSFVSLRDVERVLEVMIWFYRQTEEEGLLSEENMDFDEDTVKIQVIIPWKSSGNLLLYNILLDYFSTDQF